MKWVFFYLFLAQNQFYQFPSNWCKTKTDSFTTKGDFLTMLQQDDEKNLFLIKLGQRTAVALVLKGTVTSLPLAIDFLSVVLQHLLNSWSFSAACRWSQDLWGPVPNMWHTSVFLLPVVDRKQASKFCFIPLGGKSVNVILSSPLCGTS